MPKPIAEGGYGCVFHPGFDCNGDIYDKGEESISKIVVKNQDSLKEIENSKYIRRIPNYKSFFLPVINDCTITHVNLVEKLKIKGCSIVNKSNSGTGMVVDTGAGVDTGVGVDTGADVDTGTGVDTGAGVGGAGTGSGVRAGKQYIILEIPYLKNNYTVYDLKHDKNRSLKDHILIIFETYRHLLKSLYKLREIDFMHHDLHSDNILYSKSTGLSYIIDFGLSIPYENLNQDTWTYYFYLYAPTAVWSLEIQTINYLLHPRQKLEKFDDTHIKFIVENYTKNISALNLCTEEFRIKYKEASIQYLSQYDGKFKFAIINELLETRNTWNLYSVSILFLRYIYKIFTVNHILFVKNELLIGLCQILFTNINPYVSKRFSIEETEKRWNELLMGESYSKSGDSSKLLQDYLSLINYLDREMKPAAVSSSTSNASAEPDV